MLYVKLPYASTGEVYIKSATKIAMFMAHGCKTTENQKIDSQVSTYKAIVRRVGLYSLFGVKEMINSRTIVCPRDPR